MADVRGKTRQKWRFIEGMRPAGIDLAHIVRETPQPDPVRRRTRPVPIGPAVMRNHIEDDWHAFIAIEDVVT